MSPTLSVSDNRVVYPVVIEGERVWLREFEAADGPAVQRWTGDVAVVQYVPLGPTDDEGARRYVASIVAEASVSERSTYTLAVMERDGNDPIGAVALTVDSTRHRRGELGYLLRQDRWGRGLATEAARLVVDFAFRDLGLHRVWAVCDPENQASGAVLTKLGMQREGLLRHDLLIGDEWRDSALYAVLEDDWDAEAVYL